MSILIRITRARNRSSLAPSRRRAASEARARVLPWPRLGALLVVVVGLLSAGGCVRPTPPSESELTEMAQEGTAIALVRLDVQAPDGQSINLFAEAGHFIVPIGDLETGGKPEKFESMRYLSQELREAGWAFLILSPGRHYLYVITPFQQATIGSLRFDKNMYVYSPRLIVDIPTGARVIYLGTIGAKAIISEGLFGETTVVVLADPLVANEEDVARAIAAQHLASLGLVETALMRVHTTNTFEF